MKQLKIGLFAIALALSVSAPAIGRTIFVGSGDIYGGRRPKCSFTSPEYLNQTTLGQRLLQLIYGISPEKAMAIMQWPPTEPYRIIPGKGLHGVMRWTSEDNGDVVEVVTGFKDHQLTEVHLIIVNDGRRCTFGLED